MLRVRAQLSFHTFRYGDVFTIDETHPHWAEPLAQGWVAPVDHEVTVPDDGAWKPGKLIRASDEMRAEHSTTNLDAALRQIRTDHALAMAAASSRASTPQERVGVYVPGQPETL